MTVLLVIELIALAVGVTAELIGVFRHKRGQIDTYSEIVWWLRDRLGIFSVPILAGFTGLMLWAIPHLWLG